MVLCVVLAVGPLPPYIHLASTWRHSRNECSQAFPALIFINLPIMCIIVNANGRSKHGRPWTEATVSCLLLLLFVVLSLYSLQPASTSLLSLLLTFFLILHTSSRHTLTHAGQAKCGGGDHAGRASTCICATTNLRVTLSRVTLPVTCTVMLVRGRYESLPLYIECAQK